MCRGLRRMRRRLLRRVAPLAGARGRAAWRDKWDIEQAAPLAPHRLRATYCTPGRERPASMGNRNHEMGERLVDCEETEPRPNPYPEGWGIGRFRSKIETGAGD